jgi:hypothetical protein
MVTLDGAATVYGPTSASSHAPTMVASGNTNRAAGVWVHLADGAPAFEVNSVTATWVAGGGGSIAGVLRRRENNGAQSHAQELWSVALGNAGDPGVPPSGATVTVTVVLAGANETNITIQPVRDTNQASPVLDTDGVHGNSAVTPTDDSFTVDTTTDDRVFFGFSSNGAAPTNPSVNLVPIRQTAVSDIAQLYHAPGEAINTTVSILPSGNNARSSLVAVFNGNLGAAPTTVVIDQGAGPLEVTMGDTLQLTATVENASGSTTWDSDTPGVATVNSSGLVTPVSVGSTLITVTNNSVSDTVVVDVVAAPETEMRTFRVTSVPGGAYSEVVVEVLVP